MKTRNKTASGRKINQKDFDSFVRQLRDRAKAAGIEVVVVRPDQTSEKPSEPSAI